VTDDANGDKTGQGQSLTERVFGRVVGSVVSPVVDSVDVDQVVERIDINHIVERVDVDDLVERIDVDRVIARVDVDAVLAGVDVNALLDRVDPDRLLDRVDADRLLARVDVNALLDRVDPDRLLDRVDADRLLERVDVNSLVERTELGAIIARSTTGVFTQVLDVARTQIIAVDQVAQGVPARLIRGTSREVPPTPSGASPELDLKEMTITERAVAMQHHVAGSVSRFLAFLLDNFIIGLLFGLGAALTTAAIQVVIGRVPDVEEYRWLVVVSYALWAFSYTAGSLAASGRTIGKAILGVMVVQADGSSLRARQAALRTILFPVSFMLFGIGFLIGLVRRDRRELHDLLAGTSVIYAWDAATAQLRSEAAATAQT